MIERAFENFEINSRKIPISCLNFKGKSDTYLTYYTWFDKPESFYDDEYHAEITYGTIDIFSKGNFKPVLKQVKNKLKQNGFTWTNNGPEDYDEKTGYYHVPVNFLYTNSVEND